MDISLACFAPLLFYRALRTLRLNFYRKERKALRLVKEGEPCVTKVIRFSASRHTGTLLVKNDNCVDTFGVSTGMVSLTSAYALGSVLVCLKTSNLSSFTVKNVFAVPTTLPPLYNFFFRLQLPYFGMSRISCCKERKAVKIGVP